MADTAAPNYIDLLSQALIARKDWLEKAELTKLKEELRIFQISYSVLYNMFLKKKLINEDPYKQESKISDLEIPETGPFNEAKKREQISLRLASYDSQLDFLVNFYQFGVDFLNVERIRRIVGLVRYIDWMNLTPDSQANNTKVVAEIVNNAKSGGDALTLSIIGESLTKLPKCTTTIIKILRDLSIYHKESYKLNVRKATVGMQAGEANAANIKKKMSSAMPGTMFYQEFVDEMLKEDFSKDGPAMREAILKALKVTEEKPKATKPKVDYKGMVLSGIIAIGNAASVLHEIAQKIDANEEVLEDQKKGFWYKLKQIIRAMMHSEPEAIFYDLLFIDNITGVQKKETINLHQFRGDMEKKIRILTGMSANGPVMAKLRAMNEEQCITYLERTIRDVQNYHRLLTSLDDYFKSNVSQHDRSRIKGIKPELASLKNCIVKANQLRAEYTAAKEEEEQMKRLGINPGA